MDTKSIAVNFPLNTLAIVIDVELLIPISALKMVSAGDFAFSSTKNESCFTLRIPSAHQIIDFTKEKE